MKTPIIGLMIFLFGLFSTISSSSFVNVQSSDVILNKDDSFDYSIPSDTFEKNDNSSIYISITPNEWISVTYESPELKGYYPLVHGCKVLCKDSTCFVMDSFYGLVIFDLTKPNDISILSILQITVKYCSKDSGIFLDGSLLYLSGDNCYIVDVNDPRKPLTIGQIQLSSVSSVGYGVRVYDDVVYITYYSSELGRAFSMYDVSNPASPSLLHAMNGYFSSGIYDVVVNTTTHVAIVSYAIGSSTYGLKYINVTNPSEPNILSTMASAKAIRGLFLRDNLLYFCESTNGIKIYDVSNIYAPFQVGGHDPGSVVWISVSESTDTMMAWDNIARKLYIYDTTTKSSPTYLIDIEETFDHTFLIEESNTLVCIGDDLGLSVYDVSTLASPQQISLQSKNLGRMKKLTLEGNLVFVAFQNSMRIFDIEIPSNPVLVGFWEYLHATYQEPDNIIDFALRGGLMSVITNDYYGDFFFYIFNVSKNHSSSSSLYMEFEQLDKLQIGSSLSFLSVEDDYAFIASSMAFTFVDISDPTNVKKFTNGFHPHNNYKSMFLRNHTLFVCPSSGTITLKIFNVSNITTISQIGSITNLQACKGMDVSGDYLYIAEDSDGIKIYDISDLSNIVLVGELDSSQATSVHVDNDFVFLADMVSLKVIDVSKKDNPTLAFEIFSTPSNQVKHAVTRDNMLYYLDVNMGLRVVKMNLKVYGSDSFSYFCGNSTIKIYSNDIFGGEECSTSFTVSKEDFCNKRGICLADYKCNCDDLYEGTNCETWSCGSRKDLDSTCSSNGKCLAPSTCECDDTSTDIFNIYGTNCQIKFGKQLTWASSNTLAGYFQVRESDLVLFHGFLSNQSLDNFDCSLFFGQNTSSKYNFKGCKFSKSYENFDLVETTQLIFIDLSEDSIISKEGSSILEFLGETITIAAYPSLGNVPSKPSFTIRSFSKSEDSSSSKISYNEQTCKERLMSEEKCIKFFECYSSMGDSSGHEYFSIGYMPGRADSKTYYAKFYYNEKHHCESGSRFTKFKTFSLVECNGYIDFDDNFVLYERCQSDLSATIFDAEVLTYFFSTTSYVYVVILSVGCFFCGCCCLNYLLFYSRSVYLKLTKKKRRADKEEEEGLLDEEETIERSNDDDVIEEEEEEDDDDFESRYVKNSSVVQQQEKITDDNVKIENMVDIVDYAMDAYEDDEAQNEGGLKMLTSSGSSVSSSEEEEEEESSCNTEIVTTEIDDNEEEEEDDDNQPLYNKENQKEKELFEEGEKCMKKIRNEKIKKLFKELKDVKDEIKEEKELQELEGNEGNMYDLEEKINSTLELFLEKNNDPNKSQIIEEEDDKEFQQLIKESKKRNRLRNVLCFPICIPTCFCCFLGCPCTLELFKSLMMLLFIIMREGITLWFSCSEFLDTSDVDVSNPDYILLKSVLAFNQYIIALSIVLYLSLLICFILLFIGRYHFDPLMFCISMGSLKEFVFFRLFKSTFLLWFISINFYSYIIKFIYLDRFEQLRSLVDPYFWMNILIPEGLLFFSLWSVLGYNGVSSHSHLSKLKKYARCIPLIRKFPKVNIGFTKIMRDVDVILEDFFQVIFLVGSEKSAIANCKNENEKNLYKIIKKLANSDEYGHLSWEFLNGLSGKEILFLKDFFFPSEGHRDESYITIFHHHKIISKKWLLGFFFFPCRCWFGRI